MKFTLHIWRQRDRQDAGRMELLEAADVSPDMSFLEMLDEVNERLAGFCNSFTTIVIAPLSAMAPTPTSSHASFLLIGATILMLDR